MGLDQYLYRVPKGTTDINRSEEAIAALPESERVASYNKPDFDGQWHGTPTSPKHEFYNVDGVEEVGYWRKANAIHGWFVRECADGVDECQPIPVHPEQLAGLYSACKAVLAAKDDPDVETTAQLVLPPQPGFFFGSTEVDDWYFKDLEDTVRLIDDLTAHPKPGTDLVYQSSW